MPQRVRRTRGTKGFPEPKSYRIAANCQLPRPYARWTYAIWLGHYVTPDAAKCGLDPAAARLNLRPVTNTGNPDQRSTLPLALRLGLAALGVILLGLALGLDLRWFAAAAAGAFGAAELMGLALITQRFESAAARTLLGVCECLCALSVSLLVPAAMLVALIQIVHALIASGIGTVGTMVGHSAHSPRGEFFRRFLAGMANTGLALIALSAADQFDLQKHLGLDGHSLAMVCAAVVLIASVRSITELALAAKVRR